MSERPTDDKTDVWQDTRRARFYRLTRAGRKQVDRETREWEKATDIVAQFLTPKVTR